MQLAIGLVHLNLVLVQVIIDFISLFIFIEVICEVLAIIVAIEAKSFTDWCVPRWEGPMMLTVRQRWYFANSIKSVTIIIKNCLNYLEYAYF